MLPKSTGSRYPTRSNVATGPSITAATTPPGVSCLLSDPAQATPPSAVDSVDSNSVDPEAAPTDKNNNEADSAGDPSIRRAGGRAKLSSLARAFPKPPGQGPPTAWALDEDATVIAMHDHGERWEQISQHLPGRTPKACECRYAFLRHRPEWNESWKNSIAYWYQQYKSELWAHVSEKTRLPERDIEALVWHLGPWEIARRAAAAQHIA
ncbi:hypothetical protein AtubIFM54640_001226 [Aspergillus tubingensis]|nr:hypothetical protein AtubIFM54640_001226 [Aspergillus tubingensis]